MMKKVRRLEMKDETLTLLDDAGHPLALFNRRSAE
jgi:hypothetical protein